MIGGPPSSTLFPYTTLSRSLFVDRIAAPAARGVEVECGVVIVVRPVGMVLAVDPAGENGRPALARESRTPILTGGIYGENRSEEHTSEIPSLAYLVCPLLL